MLLIDEESIKITAEEEIEQNVPCTLRRMINDEVKGSRRVFVGIRAVHVPEALFDVLQHGAVLRVKHPLGGVGQFALRPRLKHRTFDRQSTNDVARQFQDRCDVQPPLVCLQIQFRS